MAPNVSTDVVLAVAESRGVDATSLPPLSDFVDPDALDALFADGASWMEPKRVTEVQFTYADHDVRIRGAGEITIQPLDRASRS